MEAEIRKLSKRADGYDSDEERAVKKPKKSYLEEELAKYAKGRGLQKKGKKKDESDVLAALNNFRGMLQGTSWKDDDDDEKMDVDQEQRGDDEKKKEKGGEGEGEGGEEEEEAEGLEVDVDRGFMKHALHFPKDNTEETNKAERDYEVIDPRQRGARAKEEEMERKRMAKKSAGGGGRRR